MSVKEVQANITKRIYLLTKFMGSLKDQDKVELKRLKEMRDIES